MIGRLMKAKTLVLLSAVFFMAASSASAGEASYPVQFGRALKRGLTNAVTAPLEIPITMQEYHEKAGRPGLRHAVGFVDGTAQLVERFGSGVFDIISAPIPGQQNGVPVKPETLF